MNEYGRNLDDLEVLLRRVHDVLIGGRERVHDAAVGELRQDAILEAFQTLAVESAEDEQLVLQEGRETTTVEGHSEVFGLQAQYLQAVSSVTVISIVSFIY